MGTRLIIIGIILGLITCGVVLFYFKTLEKKPPVVKEEPVPEPKKVGVVFAVGEIPAQTVIDTGMVTLKELEPETVSKEAITSLTSVVGGIAKVNIHPNSPVLSSQIYFGVGRLAYIVPPERRAITLLIDNPGAISYLITPGDRVDVIGTFESDFAGKLVSKTIVQSAIVLATGQQFIPKKVTAEEKPPLAFDTVTLAVYPREAEELALGADKASKLRLSLRHPTSKSLVWTDGATPPEVIDLPPEKPKDTIVIKTGTPTPTIEVESKLIKQIDVYKGTKKETAVLEWR
ncbi:MAG: Flp pilus assembly protein CpaB [bacterium]